MNFSFYKDKAYCKRFKLSPTLKSPKFRLIVYRNFNIILIEKIDKSVTNNFESIKENKD